MTGPAFDLIAAADLTVDQPLFKSGPWHATKVRGEAGWQCCTCYEWIAGRWEGFVAIRRARG